MLRVTITKRDDGRPNPWLARWREPDTGRQRKKAFPRKIDAERFADKLKADARQGVYLDPTDRTTLAEYGTRWFALQQMRPTSRARMSSQLAHITGHRLGSMRLQSIRPSDVQGFVTDRAQHLAPSTVRHLASFLRAILRAAAGDGLIAAAPIPTRTTYPELTKAPVVPLTPGEVLALADAMPARSRAVVLFMSATGLRAGEALGLAVADVNFLRREVTVRQQLSPGRKATKTKTSASQRVIPLPAFGADAASAHLAAYGPAEGGFLFSGESGLPLHPRTFYAHFERAARAVGMQVTSHHLRHTYASVLLAAGESVAAVADRLGHENSVRVLRTYGHLLKGREEHTRQAIDGVFSTRCAPPAPQEGSTGS